MAGALSLGVQMPKKVVLPWPNKLTVGWDQTEQETPGAK
jgi:hypothetical protein